jgi:hypothetical protein
MIVPAYLGSQCTKLLAAGLKNWFLGFFIWILDFYLRFRDWSYSECASNFMKISVKVWQRPRIWLDMRLMKTAWAVHWSLNDILGSGQTENSRQINIKVEIKVIIFFDIKGIVHKEFLLWGQAVNSAYYCGILLRLFENVWRFHPEIRQQESGCYITTHRPPHCLGIFTKNNISLIAHPPYSPGFGPCDFSPFRAILTQ